MAEQSSPYIPINRKNNPSRYYQPKNNGTKKKETYEQLELPIKLAKRGASNEDQFRKDNNNVV